jgi:diaminopimelate decarboxylase
MSDKTAGQALPDARALDAAIWPASAARTDSGEIAVAGIGVRKLVEQYGSPLFIYDEQDVRARARRYVQAYNTVEVPTQVFYAGKAFLCTSIVKWLTE